MKNLTVLSTILMGGLLMACNGGTPQEKAEHQMEKNEEKAYDAAKEANSAVVEATDKSIESAVYSNMAAANEAITQIPLPTLSNNTAKDLCSKIGKSIVNRINADNASKATEADKNILQEKTEVQKALADKKITAEDEAKILKYADDCIAAIKNFI